MILDRDRAKNRLIHPSLRQWGNHLMQEVRTQRLREDIVKLPAPRSRFSAPEAMAQAEAMLIQEFQQPSWEVERHPFSFTNVMGFNDQDYFRPKLYAQVDGVNIVACKPGEATQDVIIVLAHFDTTHISPGADDNTASVAALLELARLLAPYRFQKTIMLAAVDFEELGFFGAKSLVAELIQKRRILGCINFETMSYTNPAPGSQRLPKGMGWLFPLQTRQIARRKFRGDFTSLIYNGRGKGLARMVGPSLKEIISAEQTILLRDPNDLFLLGPLLRRIVPTIKNFSRSDHIAFWKQGLPAVMVTDTANFRNPHYHKPTDTPETLDYEHLAKIVVATALAVASIGEICL
jgi:hypothetical protein